MVPTGHRAPPSRNVSRATQTLPTMTMISARSGRPPRMAKKQSAKRGRRVPKKVLRLPDLDQAKSAVLNSLSSRDAQRG